MPPLETSLKKEPQPYLLPLSFSDRCCNEVGGKRKQKYPFRIQMSRTFSHRFPQAPAPAPRQTAPRSQRQRDPDRCLLGKMLSQGRRKKKKRKKRSQTTSIQDIASFLLTFMNYVFHISGAVFHKITSVIAGSPRKVLSLGFTLQI